MPAYEVTKSEDIDRLEEMVSEFDNGTPGDHNWPPLLPFGSDCVDRISSDLIPGPVGDMARAVAASTETPPEMAIMTGLGIVAACIAGKVRVRLAEDYLEPPQLYVATVLPSGNRKTPVINLMAQPIVEAEHRMISETAPERKRLESERRTREMQIDKLRRQKKYSVNSEELVCQICDLEKDLPTVPPVPRLLTQDVTPERIGSMMTENGERMALISDEAGIFEILSGRYTKSGAPNLDLFLQAHAGSPVRVDRGSREPVILNTPALTIVLTPQPQVLRSLSQEQAFRGRGLLGRFIFAVPPSNLGHRTHETIPVPTYVSDAYRDCIQGLLNISGNAGIVLDLRFSPPALEMWKSFRHHVESAMAEDGRLHDIQDWGGKLPGAVARMAGGLHCSLYAGHMMPDIIESATVTVAIELGRLLVSNAIVAFGIMQKSEKTLNAEKLLAWITRNRTSRFRVRDIFRAHQSRFSEVAAMTPVLLLLQDHGYIRPLSRALRNGRPSDEYEVNPALFQPT